MTSPDELRPGVSQGIAELREVFGEVAVVPTGDGGAAVTLAHVPLGQAMAQDSTWVGFVIPYNYDEVQVYGHFFPADLRYADGRPVSGQGITTGQAWEAKPAVKISRNSQRWRSGVDSAALKLTKTIDWLEGR